MDLDVSGSAPPNTQHAARPESNSLQFSSHFYDSITGHDTSYYRQPSTSLDLCGFSCESDNVQNANDIIDLRQSPRPTAAQKGFCTNPSCILPSPPLTGSHFKRTVPLPHIHPASAPHHHILLNHSICPPVMHPDASSYHTPPSPPLTVPLGSQSLPDTGDPGLSQFGQSSRSRASSIMERQSTLDSPELRTPVSPVWHFPSSSKSELGCILQDPMEFESDPGYIHDIRSPSMQSASLPPFEDFSEQGGSWEARRSRQPDLHSFPRWSSGGDLFGSDAGLDEDLLQPPESPRPGSMSMDLPEDDLLYPPHHGTSSHSNYGYGTDTYVQSDVEMEPFSCSIEGSHSGDNREQPSQLPRSPLLRLRACLDSDESFCSMESTMPVEENEFTTSLSLPPMPLPLSIPSSSSSPPSSPSRRSFTLLPDPDFDINGPYCPTPLAAFDSPSRRTFAVLPDLDSVDELGTIPSYSGSEEVQPPQYASPRQTLLSLPGVETDEELLPPSEPFSSAELDPAMQSDGGMLLLHPPGEDPSSLRDDEQEALASIPLVLRADPEVLAIVSLRGRLLALERRARSIESAFAARVAQTGKALLTYTYNSRQSEDLVAFDAMGELRRELKDEKDSQAVAKRVRKKEKERGREIGALIRLKVAEMAGPAGMEVEHWHGHKGKHRDCCGHGGVFTSVQQLVAKMVFKRRERQSQLYIINMFYRLCILIVFHSGMLSIPYVLSLNCYSFDIRYIG
ncbi:hypothetical protein NEOLEDRAFT_989543 [Neolentinus lepideus HHB14362 ss-1]|uniref:Uncharacterized protein n=1 Tax=Neolentinus lepideus HHB14362 ss-1 TaxID=1314782 RepID=A0A165N4J3_9AGAM|nr:hypothetical protein NEOLEDRAFT_989543 [Neolentinus lepideus HHB14362 ss-1]